MERSVVEKICTYMKKNGIMPLIEKSRAVIVGFSGGADSVFLLKFLHEFFKDKKICAAHLNHKLRGEESERDNAFCRKLCAEMGVTLFERECDISSLAKEEGLGTEACARNVRYSFFDKCRKKLAADMGVPEEKILTATAHNADDNLETFIFNSIRGSGIKGLCGIPPVKDGFCIRPILCLSSSFIREFCESKKIDYVFDSTNAEDFYTRNKIRHLVVPNLREIVPEPERSVQRLSESLRRDEEYLQLRTVSEMGKYADESFIPVSYIKNMAPSLSSRAVVRLFRSVSDAEIGAVHVDAVLDAAERGIKGELHLPGGVAVFIDEMLRFEKRSLKKVEKKIFFSSELKIGENRLDDLGYILFLNDINNEYNGNDGIVYKYLINTVVNNDKIIGNLFVRNRRESDEYFIGGHHRKLKKLMCDKKIPAEIRDRLPIVCDDAGILWVPGFPPRDGCGSRSGAQGALYISCIKICEENL